MKMLKTVYWGSTYMRYRVKLGPEDEGKTDAELIAAADHGGSYKKLRENFGGNVERLSDGEALITVYID